MALSGTSTFDLNLTEIVEEAFERAGSELRSGYDLRTARRSMGLMFAEWANRGINMWTIDSGTIAMVQGTATYNLPTDCVDVIEHVIRTGAGVQATQSDLTISRISVSTYASVPNKLFQGRPIQLLVTRAQATPTVTVWPVPDASSTYTLVYWYLRRMEDPGNGVNTQDVPFRFLPALVAGLAYYIAVKTPEGAPRITMLKQMYDEAWDIAAGEDREKASVRFVPRVGYL